MNKFEELKTAYETIKNKYGYVCKDIIFTTDEDPEEKFCELVFKYQGFPVKTTFSYGFLMGGIYPENDEITIIGDDNEHGVLLSTTVYFAICDFLTTINKNRSDEKTMNAFVDYLQNEKTNAFIAHYVKYWM